MSAKPLTAVLIAAMLPCAAIAQTTTTTTDQTLYQKGLENKGSPNAPAVNAVEGPVTDQLNTNVIAANNAAATSNTTNQAQYNADRQAYMDALAAHDRAVDRTDARYARQQNAYADAMSAWRLQVAACKKGYQRACKAPAPNPADFY